MATTDDPQDSLREQDWTGIAEGDSETWRVLITCETPRLYEMCMRSWRNPALAEELVQKTIYNAVGGNIRPRP